MADSENKRGRKPKDLAARTVRVSFARYDRARAILESLLAGNLKPAIVPDGYVLTDNGLDVIRPDDKAGKNEWIKYADRVRDLPKVQADFTSKNLNVMHLARVIREGMQETAAAHAAARDTEK